MLMVASAESDPPPRRRSCSRRTAPSRRSTPAPASARSSTACGAFAATADDSGLDKGFQAGKFGGELVRVPYVPDATRITGRRGIPIFRGTVGWYRTKLEVPVDGRYAMRFESVNHRAQVFVDGKQVAAPQGRVPALRGARGPQGRHAPHPRRPRRLARPDAMKRDGWHRLWFNFGGINREVSIRRIGDSELPYPMMRTRLANGAALVDLRVHVRNNGEPRAIGVTGTLTSGDRTIAFEFPAEPLAKEGTGCSRRRCKVDDPALWSPSTPNLWYLELEVPGESTYRARVGLREVARDGTDLLLNGTPVELRGASIHEDVFGRGDGLHPDRPGPHRRRAEGDRRQRHALPAPARPGPARAPRRRRDHGLAGHRADRRAGRVDVARRPARQGRQEPRAHDGPPGASCTRRSSPGTSPTRSPATATPRARSRTSTRWPTSSSASIPAGRSRWTSGARTRRSRRRRSTATST